MLNGCARIHLACSCMLSTGQRSLANVCRKPCSCERWSCAHRMRQLQTAEITYDNELPAVQPDLPKAAGIIEVPKALPLPGQLNQSRAARQSYRSAARRVHILVKPTR